MNHKIPAYSARHPMGIAASTELIYVCRKFHDSKQRILAFNKASLFLMFFGALMLAGCATTAPPPQVSAPAELASSNIAPPAPSHVLKRKIAVGRFTNETLYGKALLTGDEIDPLGRQTSDMMATALGDTGKFVVLERTDIGLVKGEQALTGVKSNIVGANDLLIGSLTQFGRETVGESGFLSNTKKQIAYAKVESNHPV
jgi:curli biogenesis system outer membrane secretion channel CsgG